MTERQTFRLVTSRVRDNAIQAVREAPEGYAVLIRQPTRTLDQNAHFHAICTDLAKSPLKFAGKRRTLEEWKALLISGHAVATDKPGEVIPGIEGEFVAIRESSASMSISRASSLIDYSLAYCAMNGVELHETRHAGFRADAEAMS